MIRKPKIIMWLIALFMVIGLIWFALYRTKSMVEQRKSRQTEKIRKPAKPLSPPSQRKLVPKHSTERSQEFGNETILFYLSSARQNRINEYGVKSDNFKMYQIPMENGLRQRWDLWKKIIYHKY